MRGLTVRLEELKGDLPLKGAVLRLSGFVNASTNRALEDALGNTLAKNIRFLVIDFLGVDYINSLGISTLLTHYQSVRAQNGDVALIKVHRDVGRTMHVLGLTSLVPFLKDEKAAADYFVQVSARRSPQETRVAVKPKPAAKKQVASFPIRRPAAGVKGTVLMVSPTENLFTDVLKLRFEKAGGKFTLVRDAASALASIDKDPPDVVVLENALPGSDDFLKEVKVNKGRSLVSVIKIYQRDADIGVKSKFKIWEDDYLVEPFDMLELYALIEAEIVRAPKARASFLHQLHLTFKGATEPTSSAHALAKNLINEAGFAEDEAVTVFAAFQEAVDNAHRHGNRYNEDKRIDCVFLLDKDKLVMTVEDEGGGFDHGYFTNLAEELDAVERARHSQAMGRSGGLGIKLMLECMDGVNFVGRGNKVRLEKKVGAKKPAAAPVKA